MAPKELALRIAGGAAGMLAVPLGGVGFVRFTWWLAGVPLSAEGMTLLAILCVTGGICAGLPLGLMAADLVELAPPAPRHVASRKD